MGWGKRVKPDNCFVFTLNGAAVWGGEGIKGRAVSGRKAFSGGRVAVGRAAASAGRAALGQRAASGQEWAQIYEYPNIWIIWVSNTYSYSNYYIVDIQIYMNAWLKIKIYLQIFVFCFISLFPKMSAYKCLFSCFSRWSQSIFKYSFKLVPQIYSNIHLWSFQSFKYTCILVRGGPG